MHAFSSRNVSMPSIGLLVSVRSLLRAAVVLLSFVGTAIADSGMQHHTAVWFEPARPGEGWVVEVLPDTRVAVTWYTYDLDGRPLWLFGVEAEDRETGFNHHRIELFRPSGGGFSDFDPDSVSFDSVGFAELSFTGCQSAVFTYDVFGESDSYQLQRLSETMAADCGPSHGSPGEMILPYAADTGSWFQRDRNGEGIQIQWNVRNEALLTWYAFKDDGTPFWLIGVGTFTEGRISFPVLLSGSGAVFGSGFDPNDVVLEDWGSLELSLDCDEGSAQFVTSAVGFSNGSRSLSKLTSPLGTVCPWVRPSIGEVFRAEVLAHPPDEITAYLQRKVFPGTISDAGDLAAIAVNGAPPGTTRAEVFRRDTGLWEPLPPRDLSGGGFPALLSSDGDRVAATEALPAAAEQSVQVQLLDVGGAWESLPGAFLHTSFLFGGSSTLDYLVGTGATRESAAQVPWIWSRESGQTSLGTTEEVRLATPLAVSGDGRKVVGFSLRTEASGSVSSRAIIWADGSPPRHLVNQQGEVLAEAIGCALNCDLIFGSGHSIVDRSKPETGQGWIQHDGEFLQYMGPILGRDATEELPSFGYRIKGVSDDGRVAVGLFYENPSPGESVVGRALIWTPRTGVVALEDLLEDSGSQLPWQDTLTVQISRNGRHIAVSGSVPLTSGSVTRTASVHLVAVE